MMRPSGTGACLFVVLLLGLLLLLPGCQRVFCSDRVGQSAVSQDGRYVADVMQSDCGAREHATVVELRRNRLLLKDRRIAFLIGGFRDVSVVWRDKSQLVVVAPTCEAGKIELRNWKNDVTVRCEVAGAAAK